MAQYDYSISGDTATGAVDNGQLWDELLAIAVANPGFPALENVASELDVLSVFYAGALSAPQEALLTGAVGAHTPAPPVSPQPTIENQLRTTDPTVNDDDSLGYAPGVRWLNVTGQSEFITTDSTAGAAVWKATTSGGGLSTIPTGNTLWVDATNGNDGTAVSGRLDLPWLTIAAALGAAVSGDRVQVYPGSYAEAVTVPSGVSLTGMGGPERVLITGPGGAVDTVTLGDGSYVHSIGATAPSGAAAFKYSGATLCYLYNAMMTGTDGTSLGFAHTGTGKIIITELRFVGGDFDAVIQHTGSGILALTGLHIPGGGAIASAIRASGGARLQLNDVNSGNPAVTDAVECGQATVVMRSSALFNCANGLHITDNAANVQWTSVRFDNTSAFDILVDPALTGSGGTVNLTACEIQEQKLSIPATWLASDHNWTFQDAKSDIDDASFRAFTDLTVGHFEKGFRSDFGSGCPTPRGMKVITSDATTSGNLTDVSTEAQSKAGSTFSFQGVTAGHCIYFGSELQDVGGVMKSWGAEFAVAVARADGFIVAEYWGGAAWLPIGAAESLASAPYTASGPNLFLQTTSVQVRLGLTEDTTWAIIPVAGFSLYWWRLRIRTEVTTAPVFEQSKLHTSCTRMGTDGVIEFFGTARQRLDQSITLRDTDDLNGISPGNVDIFFGTLGGFPLTADINDNNFQNTATDGNALVWPLSPNLDTSLPVTLRIWWIPNDNTAGDVEWEYGHRSVGVGSKLNGSQALDFQGTVLATVALNTIDDLRFTDLPVDISASSASGGLLAIAWQRDGGSAGDSYSGDVQLVGIQLLAYQWRI